MFVAFDTRGTQPTKGEGGYGHSFTFFSAHTKEDKKGAGESCRGNPRLPTIKILVWKANIQYCSI